MLLVDVGSMATSCLMYRNLENFEQTNATYFIARNTICKCYVIVFEAEFGNLWILYLYFGAWELLRFICWLYPFPRLQGHELFFTPF